MRGRTYREIREASNSWKVFIVSCKAYATISILGKIPWLIAYTLSLSLDLSRD